MMKLDIQFFALEVGDAEVTYTDIYTGENVTSVQVDVRVPAKDGETSGYVTLGKVEGWSLSEGNTKLTKVYTENKKEIITISLVEFKETSFEGVTTYETIGVYNINANSHTAIKIDYLLETNGKIHRLVASTITVFIKETSKENYQLSESNIGWTLSENKDTMTKTVESNISLIEPIWLFPKGDSDLADTQIEEEIAYKIDKVGLTIEEPIVTYKKDNNKEDVIGAEVNIIVPYTLGTKSGYATVGEVLGWDLTEEYTKLSKTYQDNIEETITIPVTEADGYNFEALNTECNIKIDYIDFRKIVKGRCPTTKCFYDVYTTSEIENYKLKLEEKLKIMTNTTPLYELIGDTETLATVVKDTIVGAINEVVDKITPVTLYESEGTRETLQLTDSVTNYSAIEIIYGADMFYNTTGKIYSPNGKTIATGIQKVRATTSYIDVFTSDWTISENKITFVKASNKYIMENSTATFGTNSYIDIYKVIGYK